MLWLMKMSDGQMSSDMQNLVTYFPLRQSYSILGLYELCREIHKLRRILNRVQNGRGVYSFWYLGMQAGDKESLYVGPSTERP